MIGKPAGKPAAAPDLRDLARLRRVRDRIDREYAEPLDVEALARDAHMSAGHFSRQFRLAYGESPYSYLMTRRIERAMALLRRGEMSVTEVCFEVGCSSLGTFSTRFTELVGVSPSVYRRDAARATEGMPSCVAKQVTRPVRHREAPAPSRASSDAASDDATLEEAATAAALLERKESLMRARFVFALAALCASPLVAAPLQPSVTFSPTGPVASVTAGGQLILLGVSKEYDDGVRRLLRSEAALTDDDQDGSVSLELGQEASPQSAWIAVDLESGAYAVDGPDESLLTSVPLGGDAVQHLSEGGGDELVIEGRWSLHVLLVRPKVGAWVASVTDGGVDDLDGIGDGIVHFPLERLEPLDGSPALDSPSVATGDVLLAVVPETPETLVGPIPNP